MNHKKLKDYSDEEAEDSSKIKEKGRYPFSIAFVVL